VILSCAAHWAAQAIVVLSARCNDCQNAPGAEGSGLVSGAGGEHLEPHTIGASCILRWDTFPTIYHTMHKGSAMWEGMPGRTFSREMRSRWLRGHCKLTAASGPRQKQKKNEGE